MQIDAEFKGLIPSLTADEREQLEINIKTDGCRDPLVTWNGVLIDGHNRFEICRRLGIEFDTKEIDLPSRNDAIIWIIKNQFGRRNLPDYERAKLALRLKPAIAERAREKQGERTDIKQNSAESSINTRAELAKAAGVSHDTIAKVERIEQQADPELKQAITAGRVSINAADQIATLPADEQREVLTLDSKQIVAKAAEIKKAHVANNSGDNEWYTPEPYIAAARAVMGGIYTDPASSEIANTVVKAEHFFTAEQNGLEQEWHGNVWMNPPYASDLVGKFAEKLATSVEYGNVPQAVVLVNNATETRWFARLAGVASMICFPSSRVRFWKPESVNAAPLQGQAVLYFGANTQAFAREFKQFGIITQVIR
jgi:phage N-6-adenine-methyltransferase